MTVLRVVQCWRGDTTIKKEMNDKQKPVMFGKEL